MPIPKPKPKIKVFMYEAELNYLKWLVVQKADIETGGDLFGLWQNEHTAIVQLILGPGKDCSRTTTSFHQDVNYLGDVGEYLTSSQGLCNIGEWHSHHRIGLTEPSGGDQRTVWRNMPEVAGGRFLLFIAHIVGPESDPKVKVPCFVFNNATKKMVVGKIESLPSYSPLRDVTNEKYLKPRSEPLQDWGTFLQCPYVHKISKQIRKNQEFSKKEMKNVSDESFGDDNEDDRLISETRNDEEANTSRCYPCTCAGATERLKRFRLIGAVIGGVVSVAGVVVVFLLLKKQI